MAEGESSSGGGAGSDPWIWFFIILIIAAIASSTSGSGIGFFGQAKGNIKYGSPSSSGTVEEEIRSSRGFLGGGGGIGQPPPAQLPPPVPLPSPVPLPPSVGTPGSGTGSGENRISLSAYGNTRLPYETEYLQISAAGTNPNKTVITGMVLKNKNNESAIIGPDENGNPISLGPGERATISTVASPRGYNFKLNKCSGYIAQSKIYYPSISRSCPRLTTLPGVRDLTENCQRYLASIPSCTTPNINFSTGIDNKCAEFIGKHASYPGCVNDFKQNSDFDQKEWRIYLARTREFWSNFQEDIQLYNQSGILISKTSY